MKPLKNLSTHLKFSLSRSHMRFPQQHKLISVILEKKCKNKVQKLACVSTLRNDSDFPRILIVALLQPAECVLNICFMISSFLLQKRRNAGGISQDDSTLFSIYLKGLFFFSYLLGYRFSKWQLGVKKWSLAFKTI